jgi:hypothetical protein
MCIIIIIVMNETMSLVLATTLLALGGLGLYMLKKDDEPQKGRKVESKEKNQNMNMFGWNNGETDEDEEDAGNEHEHEEQHEDEEEEEYYVKQPKRKPATKTQRNRKASGASKRRY